MNVPRWISPFFIAAGLYDGILGAIFLIVPLQFFNKMNVPPPNHIGYIQFPALLLIIFAIMFFNIAKNPIANKGLIPYGILLKLSYCSTIFLYWSADNIPFMWVPFAFFDLAFLVVFILAYNKIKIAA